MGIVENGGLGILIPLSMVRWLGDKNWSIVKGLVSFLLLVPRLLGYQRDTANDLLVNNILLQGPGGLSFGTHFHPCPLVSAQSGYCKLSLRLHVPSIIRVEIAGTSITKKRRRFDQDRS